MATSQTGKLDKAFLDSTYTVPSVSTYFSNGFGQSGKGRVTHDVTAPGTPITARNPNSAVVTTGVNKFTGKAT